MGQAFSQGLLTMLREKSDEHVTYVYIDDIIIFSNDYETHLQNVAQVLEILYSANMRVSLDKSQFIKSDIEFLGFVVSHDGIRMTKDKLKDIVDYEFPKILLFITTFSSKMPL